MTIVEPHPLTPYDEPFRAERAPFRWLVEREVLRFLNIWPYTVAGPVLSTVLFVVVFGSALGRHVAPIDGVPYGQFIVPGLVAQAVLTVGFVNGTTSLFEARRDKYVNDVFASPLRWWEINAALVAGGLVRGTIVGAGVLAISVPLAHITDVARPVVFVFGSLATLVAAGQIESSPVAWPKSLDQVYSMEAIVVVPLTFVAGVFYSVAELPGAFDAFSRLNPVFWLVQVTRIGILGGGDVGAGTALTVVWAVALGLSVWSAAIFATDRLKA